MDVSYSKDNVLLIGYWWCTPGVPALGRLSQEAPKFKASLGYIASSFLKNEMERILQKKIFSFKCACAFKDKYVFHFCI